MRVLLLTQDFPPGFVGGVASWAWDAAAALQAAGHEVRVLARRTGDTRHEDAAAPFAIHRVRGRSWGRWQGLWLGMAARRHLAWADRVLAATWPCAVGLPSLACPLWVGVHGSEITQLDTPSGSLVRLQDRVDGWLPVSRYLADQLERHAQPRVPVRVPPMPLEVPADEPVPWEDRGGLVVLARLTPLKGVDRALRLSARLGQPLTVIGEGPERATLERLAPPGTVFCGRQPRRVALGHVARARALLLLPRPEADGRGAEGLGLVALEAAARGTPVVGCHTGGVPEAVGPGLVLDDPEHPTLDPINALLADRSAGAAARTWVRSHHGAVAFVRELEAL